MANLGWNLAQHSTQCEPGLKTSSVPKRNKMRQLVWLCCSHSLRCVVLSGFALCCVVLCCIDCDALRGLAKCGLAWNDVVWCSAIRCVWVCLRACVLCRVVLHGVVWSGPVPELAGQRTRAIELLRDPSVCFNVQSLGRMNFTIGAAGALFAIGDATTLEIALLFATSKWCAGPCASIEIQQVCQRCI